MNRSSPVKRTKEKKQAPPPDRVSMKKTPYAKQSRNLKERGSSDQAKDQSEKAKTKLGRK